MKELKELFKKIEKDFKTRSPKNIYKNKKCY